MSLKKKYFNILPRKYSYGGLMDTLSKSVPLASKQNLMINVVDLNINVKKEGNLIVKDISNSNDYKNLTYKNKKFIFFSFKIFKLKLFILIKLLCLRYSFFSLIIKSIFFLTNFNFQKSKIKYRNFLNNQNYFDGNTNIQNFGYLKSLNISLDEGEYQNKFLERESFGILNEEEKYLNFKKLYDLDLNEKYICFYLREKEFNLKNPLLKKREKIIWYKKKIFFKVFEEIFNNKLNIFDLSVDDNFLVNNKKYFHLKNKNINNEIYLYIIAKNSKLFFCTGGGKCELAKLFKKPMLKVDHEYNVLNNFDFSTLQDHIIFPYIYSKNLKKFLSIKDQFNNLDKIFPKSKNSTNFEFNYDDFILIENSEQDILNLYKNYSFETNKMEENRNAQNEIFDLKKYYVKKNLPDYFYYMNLNYPNNPIICKKFFEMNFDYNEYLNKKSENFIKKLL